MTETMPITDEMKQIAEAIERTVIMNLKTVSNYQLDEEHRFYNGALGELAFFELLKANGKQAHFKPSLTGGDNGDITIQIPVKGMTFTRPATIDIKTASQARYRCLMMPLTQYNKYKRAAYVGIRLNGDFAEILGYCTHHELVDVTTLGVTPKIPTMGILLTSLKPIGNILDNIASGEAVMDLSNVDKKAIGVV